MKSLYITAILCVLFQMCSGQNIPDDGATAQGSPLLVTMPSVFTPVSSSSTGTHYYNFSRAYTPQVATTNANDAEFQFGANNSGVRTTYQNGFGQPIETIYRSYAGDIVAPNDGRPSLTRTSFLPYVGAQHIKFQQNPFPDQQNFYNTAYPDEGGVGYTQAVATYPVNGGSSNPTPTTATYAAGIAFGQSPGAGNAIATTTMEITDVFAPIYSVPDFLIDASGQPSSMIYYPPNYLTCKHVVGQNGRETYSFYDMNNRLVCKKQNASAVNSSNALWLTTCYAYNDLGQLAAIMPPKACSQILANTMNTLPYPIDAGIISGLCYTYQYDINGHVVQRHVPGETQAEQVVYDRNQRPVMFQSPLLAQQGKWKFIIYDTQDRPVMTGLINSTNTQAAWQSMMGGTGAQDPLANYIINGFSGTTYPPQLYGTGTILTYNYYDNYTRDPQIAAAATFNTSFAGDYSVSDITPVPYMNTKGMLTATKVYNDVSVPNQWTTSINFYDQAGHLIQTKTEGAYTPPNNWDTHTVQYNFAGSVVRDILQENTLVGSKPSTKMVKQFTYDVLNGGRLLSEHQKLDNDVLRLISSYTYDNLGRVTQKSLGGVENQAYTYNIRGQLTGINPAYAQNNPVAVPDVTFGCNLDYDFGFTEQRMDGKISGMTWRGAGFGAPLRAYGYDYDNAGRLTDADFRELINVGVNTWNSQGVSDFSMNGVTYDDGGNILTMNQMGNTIAGVTQIDRLIYQYQANSNQLNFVKDGITTNYGLGDFIDGHVGADDYTYDADGNLTQDLNKGISNITYNYQDLPTAMTQSAGSVQNVYDANGNLVRKTVTQGGTSNVYIYDGPFVYQNNALSYLTTEEGRCRWLTDSLFFKYDFFVKDHLGNVRTVLTSDAYNDNLVVHQPTPSSYWATYEIAASNVESALFNNVGTVAEANPNPSANDMMAARLNGAEEDRQVGTSIMLHVMAGDKFDVSALSYWTDSAAEVTYTEPYNIMTSLIASLTGGAGGTGVAEGASATYINTMESSLVSNFKNYQDLFTSATVQGVPHAYLNYLVFDENMNLIPEQSGAIQVGSTAGSWQAIRTGQPISLNQNGYAAFYISNAEFTNVYFNNFNVVLYRGRLLEEQHYYPFGLTVKDGGQNNTPLPNKFLCEGNELHDELNINLYDFNARQYDAQIGRFVSIDPLADEAGQEGLSPYHFCANDPANYTDPTGLHGTEPYNPGNTVSNGGDVGGDDNTKNQANGTGNQGSGPGNGDYGATASTLDQSGSIPVTQTLDAVMLSFLIYDVSTMYGLSITTNPMHTLQINETVQDLTALTPPPATGPTIGDLMAATTGTFGTIITNNVSAAASGISGATSSIASPDFFHAATAIASATVSITMNSLGHSLSHFSLADVGFGGGPLSFEEEGMEELGEGMKGLGEIKSVTGGGLKFASSVKSAMGDSYSTVAEVTVAIKNNELLDVLNGNSKGDWVKVYEAGLQDGNEIETHYFRNNTTGEVFDVKTKYNYWNQKAFKKLR